MDEVPHSCIGTPTLVGKEETPWVMSFLPVGLGPISDGHTPNTRIGFANSRISVRLTMT